MIVATWNVNSIKQRLEHALDWLKQHAPDIVCLQEIKCQDEAFPTAAFEDAGYTVATHGQKGFNGVALLVRGPIEEVRRGLPGDADDHQARYLEALVATPNGAVRVASIYLPNGNPVASEKFPYKLAWMARLVAHARELLAAEEPVVLAGDYNVIPDDEDCHDPAAWAGDALFQPESRGAFRALCHLGYRDAVRSATDAASLYTFWDYQAGAFPRDRGIRIDHILLSPRAADGLVSVAIDKAMRGRDKPSDHVPVRAELRL